MSDDQPPDSCARRRRRGPDPGGAGRLQLPGPVGPADSASVARRRPPATPGAAVGHRPLSPRPPPWTWAAAGRDLGLWRHRARAAAASHAGDLLRVGRRQPLAGHHERALARRRAAQRHGRRPRDDPGAHRRPGSRFTYEFTVPDPGTYFYHPHSGVQLDRGLYGVLVVDDPARGRRLRRRVGRRPRRLGRRHRPHPRRGPRRPQGGMAAGRAAWAAWAAWGGMGGMDHGAPWDGRHGRHAVPAARRRRRRRLPALPDQRPGAGRPVTLQGQARPAGADPHGQRRLRHRVPGRRSAATG